jgi:hypothetical protein
MLKDKPSKSPASPERNDSKVTLINFKGTQDLKSLDNITSAGFVCDINTGVCGPVTKEKEGKE